MTLMYAKGVRYYEDEPVADATIEDLDLDFVRSYCKRIGYSKSPEEYVRENKKFVTVKDGKDQISVAAILLFGKNPQTYFPRAFIRFIRYVKEYGEGVDRMCKELEAVGLPDPAFNYSTFILKTTVMSASFGVETTDSASISHENASIEQNDASIHGKDGLMARLHMAEAAGEVSSKDAADAEVVLENVDVMQVITSKEVMKILSCQTTKARLVLKMMESQKLIKTIQGKGKGKYILNVSD